MIKEIKRTKTLAVLQQNNITSWTKVQKNTIAKILKNENMIIVSATGTGKTFCYLLPIFEKIIVDNKQMQALIILPTRELARQVYSKAVMFCDHNDINVKLLIGGKENKKLHYLKNNFQILIATPAKFLQACQEKVLNFNALKFLVFDEADMLIDLGFRNLFAEIFANINAKNFQKIALSATLHEKLAIQLAKYFTNSKIYQENKNIWINNAIEHYLIHYNTNKLVVFEHLIKMLNPFCCIIFANTQKQACEIFQFLSNIESNVLLLHGNLHARERKNVYKKIKQFDFKYLVATDLASRGIDIEGVSHVISWNLAKDDLWYIHRSGRSGRKNYVGKSYLFMEEKDKIQVSRLKRKGINWINLKFHNNKFIDFNYKFIKKINRPKTEVDNKINYIINTSNKKVKPNYKKKIKLQIKNVKQKAKRQAIEAAVKQNLIKKYKIASYKKSILKNKGNNYAKN